MDQDLSGKRFGSLLVLGKVKNENNRSVWQCQCDCGNITYVRTYNLKSGSTSSCGCKHNQSSVHEGDKYGMLTAIRPTDKRSGKAVLWECLCECGNTVNVRASYLTSGHTTSCGCKTTSMYKAKNISTPLVTTSPDTGVRGVVLLKDGRYRAQLKFQNKYYYLGRYKKLEDAIKARKQAEERIIGEYLDAYESTTDTE